MKISLLRIIALIAIALGLGAVNHLHAQTTAFTYQGKLNDNGAPANGNYDLQFSLRDALAAGNQIGSPVTTAPVAVSNGLFTVTLDFGPGVFNGNARWLEIGVRTNGSAGAYALLVPRQAVTSSPYAIQSANAATAANVTGPITDGQLSSNIPRLNTAANFSGTVTANNFTGNGAGLTNLAAANLTGKIADARLSTNVALLNVPNTTTQATATATLTSGFITGTTVTSGGSGYLIAPAVTVNDTTGSSAVITANISGGAVVSLNIQNAGNNYSGGTTLTIAPPPSNAYQTFNSTSYFSGVSSFGGASTFSGPANFSPASGAPFTVNSANKVINLNADFLDGLDSTAFWNRAGNAGTTPGTHFIGTTDNQALEFRVNNRRVLRLEPTSDTPNVIGGYSGNYVQPGLPGVTIGGGGTVIGNQPNIVTNSANYATIAGGYHNTVTNYGGAILGGSDNFIGGTFSAIGAGQVNIANSDYAWIGGGSSNNIQRDAPRSTIGGGANNTIQANATYSTIGGGYNNTIQTNAFRSTIGGGYNNTIQINATDSTIGGGYNNIIQTNAYGAMIGGGVYNFIQANASYSTIGGGYGNTIQTNASDSIIGGGIFNSIQTNAVYSTIGGGYGNTMQTNAAYSTIPGGYLNVAGGTNSFAAGTRAQANHAGAFVWADYNNFNFPSLVANSFSVRSVGGARFVTAIDGAGTPTAGVSVGAGGTSWAAISDRNAKKNFQSFDKKEVLEKLAAMPVEHWNYKWESNSEVPHIGPVTQDFKAAFYPGRDDKSITTMEFDGVELAAIQGLNEAVKEKDAKITNLEKRLNDLEQLVRSLAEKK